MTPWVTFDFDNTLVKNPYWRLHFRPWLDAEAIRQGTDWRSLWGQFRLEGERRWRAGDWVASFDWVDIANHLGLTPLPDPPRPQESALRPLVLPGAEATLMQLRRLPIRLGLVTNGLWRFQKPYLDALGWNYWFDAIITPDRAGFAKPSPAIMADVSPGLAHVGDRLFHDVLVARRSHRLGILLGVPGQELDRLDPLCPSTVQPDFTIPSLDRLFPLIVPFTPTDGKSIPKRFGNNLVVY
ncbi:HAD family hydrolase [Sulfobacillus harzensis]|uniref:HAD family hydrolase n=1 Tax=Sulfobacillus harzensis TaxID=2729629 RepID=A0A7Y0L3R7_9FIRM|nr:HAD family hydrolase [Sulfobacillus harzensis]NMP22387.1 HAD family hydrolase [Sulfobacillus harzensis]